MIFGVWDYKVKLKNGYLRIPPKPSVNLLMLIIKVCPFIKNY